ncbi:hypothetical protein HZ326_22339 [Fusarium oxysporum f. sp. albedinis]|nr:hypothetical protein HZ326_22339 [Fusarium oxysporum f. sp. albedinis]
MVMDDMPDPPGRRKDGVSVEVLAFPLRFRRLKPVPWEPNLVLAYPLTSQRAMRTEAVWMWMLTGAFTSLISTRLGNPPLFRVAIGSSSLRK